jgi:streptogramin lyase
MITLSEGKVWYTEIVSATVGVLDPAVASGISSTLVKTTAPVTPDCSNVGAGTTSTIATSTAALAWTNNVYQRIVNSNGWTVYRLPTGGYPWGIAASQNAVWVVDQGRQQLAWLPQSTLVYLPLIIR